MRTTHFRSEIWRLRWMIAIPVLVILSRSYGYLSDSAPLTLVLYKPALACIGAIAGHIFRTQCFYYVDFADTIRRREGLEIVGFSILFGAIYAAFILGVTLGL